MRETKDWRRWSLKRSWARWSLSQKLVLFYVPLFVLPAVIGLSLLANNYNQAIRDNAAAYSDTIVSLTVDKLDAAIDNYNRISLHLLTTSEIAALLAQPASDEFARIELQRELERYVLPITGGLADDGIQGIVFETAYGQITIGRDAASRLADEDRVGISAGNGRPYWAAVQSSGSPDSEAFRLGRVLKDDNFKPMGTLYLVISTSPFRAILNSATIGPNVTFQLVEQQSLLLREPSGLEDPSLSTLRSEKLLTHNGWRLVADHALTSLYATVYRLSIIAVWLAGGCLLLGLGASYVIRRDIALPVVRLMENMRLGLKGQSPSRLKKFRGAKEIVELNDTFISVMYEIYHLIGEVKKSEARKREAQLKVLQNQLSPHFLLNTLNSIRWMAMIRKQDHIRELVDALSRLLRYSIRDTHELVTLESEIEIMQEFVKIQQVRYQNFTFEVELQPGVKKLRMLKFLVQPLLENAIVHGLSSITHAGVIRLVARIADNSLELSVRDNGTGIRRERLLKLRDELARGANTNHIGLSNVKEMIDIHYGAPYGIDIESEPGKGTHIVLRLPALRGEEKTDV